MSNHALGDARLQAARCSRAALVLVACACNNSHLAHATCCCFCCCSRRVARAGGPTTLRAAHLRNTKQSESGAFEALARRGNPWKSVEIVQDRCEHSTAVTERDFC